MSSATNEEAQQQQYKDHHAAGYHLRHNRRLTISVLILAISYLTFGYDASVVSGCLAMPSFIVQFGAQQTNGTVMLSASNVSIITATATAAGVPGIFAVAFCADRWGRKKTLWLGCVITLAGTALQTGATDVAEITIGRVIANLGYFIMVAMTATLSTEIAPPAIRGAIGALSILFIQLGAVITSGIAWGTNTMAHSAAYRIPLGLQNLFPLIIAVGVLYVKDSPTSYLIKGDNAGAEQSLRRVRQGYSDDDILREMESLKSQTVLKKTEADVKWTDVFKRPNLRRTILSMAVGISNNLSGSVFATAYATIFLKQIGSENSFLLTFALNIIALGGSMLGLFLVDTIGRRTMALTAYSTLFAINVIIGGLGFAIDSNQMAIKTIAAFLLIFSFFNAMLIGPLVYLNAAEFSTARLRNVSTAFAFFWFSVTSLATIYIIPFITDADEGNLGAKTYIIFAGAMLICFVIAYFHYPEIKGRSAAELDEMFGQCLPARKFKRHVCTRLQDNMEIDNIGKNTVEEVEIINNSAAEGIYDKAPGDL